MNKEIRNKILLSPLRILGLIKLYRWLFNKNKVFDPKEIFINWVLTFALILAIIFGLTFALLTPDSNNLSFSELDKYHFTGTEAVLGAGSFILFIIALTTWPFKAYFRIKRKTKEIKKEKLKEKRYEEK